jgi:diguanylate cyclase (GGDEF)-like protein
MHDRAVRGQIVTVSDATDRVLAQQAVAIAASVDPETLLPNRERLVELLDMTLHRARRKGDHVALLSVGLDRHATLIEGFDETGRDAIMTEVARRIRSTIRLEDPVGRTAPDQFGVVLGGLEPRIGRAFALDVADRITRIVAEPFEVAGSRLTLAVSVGAAHRAQGQPEPSPTELLADAEESLAMVRANTNRWKDTSPA